MVAKLVAIDGPEKGLELILEKGKSWTLGRDPKECDFILDDPKVSRKHAEITLKKGSYYLKNLSRTNPVLLDDEPVSEEVKLTTNQSLKIGESHFRFSEVKKKKEDSSKDYDELFEDLDEPPIEITPGSDPDSYSSSDEDHYDTIFQDIGDEDTYGDLADTYKGSERFVLKVLTGPNTGAEFAMQKGRSYIIGTDVSGADIIFNDLSVSRHHARISVTQEDEIFIEDLDSRNGVVIDEELIKGQKVITPRDVINLGTTSFIVIDREQGEQTIVTPAAKMELEEQEEEEPVEIVETPESSKKKFFASMVSESTFIITGILVAAILLLGTGAIFLFKSSPVDKGHKDYTKSIEAVLGKEFPDVKFTFNPGVGNMFLVGHVLTTSDRDELMYKLNNLSYISQIQENLVVDEYVVDEMNLILSQNPNWVGISITAPKPGQFVLSGYLPTRVDNAALDDYMSIQFPYIDRLTNYVVIEEDLYQDILSKLHNYGFYNVGIELVNGEVTLSGYVNESYDKAYSKVVKETSRILGVRKVNDYVVLVKTTRQKRRKDVARESLGYESENVSNRRLENTKLGQNSSQTLEKTGANTKNKPSASQKRFEKEIYNDPSVINLTDYTSEFAKGNGPRSTRERGAKVGVNVINQSSQGSGLSITGFAEQNDRLRAVEINGKIYTLGDIVDGMRIIAFVNGYVFFEKNGLKYKVEYIN